MYSCTSREVVRYWLLWRLLQLSVAEKTQNVRRLEAQRNELNAKGEDVILNTELVIIPDISLPHPFLPSPCCSV